MPHLQDLSTRQDELGFRLVAISVDGTRLPEFTMHTTGGKVPFPVLLDIGGKVSTTYHITHVPTVVIIDKAGHVRYFSNFGYPGNYTILRELRKIAANSN